MSVEIVLDVEINKPTKQIIRVPFLAYTREDAELKVESWLKRWGGRVINKTIKHVEVR